MKVKEPMLSDDLAPDDNLNIAVWHGEPKMFCPGDMIKIAKSVNYGAITNVSPQGWWMAMGWSEEELKKIHNGFVGMLKKRDSVDNES